MRLRPASRGFVHGSGKPTLAIDRAALFGEHARRDAVESDARFVQQIRRQNVRRARDEILSAPRDVAAVARQRRETRAAERLEQPPIGEAVARHQIERAAERGVAAHVEMIGAIALRRRRHVVADLRRAVRAGIERRDRAADRMRQEGGKRVARRIGRHRGDARDAFIGARRLRSRQRRTCGRGRSARRCENPDCVRWYSGSGSSFGAK